MRKEPKMPFKQGDVVHIGKARYTVVKQVLFNNHAYRIQSHRKSESQGSNNFVCDGSLLRLDDSGIGIEMALSMNTKPHNRGQIPLITPEHRAILDNDPWQDV